MRTNHEESIQCFIAPQIAHTVAVCMERTSWKDVSWIIAMDTSYIVILLERKILVNTDDLRVFKPKCFFIPFL